MSEVAVPMSFFIGSVAVCVLGTSSCPASRHRSTLSLPPSFRIAHSDRHISEPCTCISFLSPPPRFPLSPPTSAGSATSASSQLPTAPGHAPPRMHARWPRKSLPRVTRAGPARWALACASSAPWVSTVAPARVSTAPRAASATPAPPRPPSAPATAPRGTRAHRRRPCPTSHCVGRGFTACPARGHAAPAPPGGSACRPVRPTPRARGRARLGRSAPPRTRPRPTAPGPARPARFAPREAWPRCVAEGRGNTNEVACGVGGCGWWLWLWLWFWWWLW